MNNFAPVLICTLNRHVHFKRCVESLAACTYAEKTDLFIGFDYPIKDTQWEGYEIIKAYLPTIKGFKSVNIVAREKNFGVNDNWTGMQNYVLERYERLIISEDDNVFAPSFLTFVNIGLEVYKDRDDIFSITGYNSPFPMPEWYKFDAYLITAFVGWGVGVWREKWVKVDWSLETFNAMLSNKENYRILKKYYQPYLGQLLSIRDTGIITGDGLLFLYLLHHKMYSVLPTKTRVRNLGHDGSGVNCGNPVNGNNIYMHQKVCEGMEEVLLPPDLQPDNKLLSLKLKQVQLTMTEKLKMKIPKSIRLGMKKIISKILQ